MKPAILLLLALPSCIVPREQERVPDPILPQQPNITIQVRGGDQFQTGPDRQAPVVTVMAIEGDEVLLDANQPLAGQELQFEVELVALRPATPAELQAAKIGD